MFHTLLGTIFRLKLGFEDFSHFFVFPQQKTVKQPLFFIDGRALRTGYMAEKTTCFDDPRQGIGHMAEKNSLRLFGGRPFPDYWRVGRRLFLFLYRTQKQAIMIRPLGPAALGPRPASRPLQENSI